MIISANVNGEQFDFEWIPIQNISTFEGIIPTGYDLVVTESGDMVKSATALSGFGEVGLFDHCYRNPVYGFMSI